MLHKVGCTSPDPKQTLTAPQPRSGASQNCDRQPLVNPSISVASRNVSPHPSEIDGRVFPPADSRTSVRGPTSGNFRRRYRIPPKLYSRVSYRTTARRAA
jgi:hypothetical protein